MPFPLLKLVSVLMALGCVAAGAPAPAQESFQREIGSDLVVALKPIVDPVDAVKPLPMVMQDPCLEPAMQTFEVMRPLLHERGFIE